MIGETVEGRESWDRQQTIKSYILTFDWILCSSVWDFSGLSWGFILVSVSTFILINEHKFFVDFQLLYLPNFPS